MKRNTGMKWSESLIFSRIGKNVLYVFAGMMLGVMMVSGKEPIRSDWIIIIVAGLFFLYESIIYLCWLISKLRNLKEKRKELLNTCRGNSESLRIINEVEKQDIEFIRLLKEEISKGHTEVGFEKEIDKLSGGL